MVHTRMADPAGKSGQEKRAHGRGGEKALAEPRCVHLRRLHERIRGFIGRALLLFMASGGLDDRLCQ